MTGAKHPEVVLEQFQSFCHLQLAQPAAALLLSLHLRRHCRAFPEQALQIRCPRLQQVHGLEQKVSHRMDLAESENHIHADSGFGRAQRPGWERQTKGTLSAFRTLELRVLFDSNMGPLLVAPPSVAKGPQRARTLCLKIRRFRWVKES